MQPATDTKIPPTASHEQLVERLRQSDPTAMADIVGQFDRMVRGVIRRRCRTADVDDLVQEVWTTLWRRVHQINSPDRLPGWLKTVAINLCNAYHGKQRAVPVAEIPECAATRTESDLAVNGLLAREEQSIVRRAIERLDEPQRRFIELHMVRERPNYNRLSQSLNRPVGSIGPTRKRIVERLSRDAGIVSLVRA